MIYTMNVTERVMKIGGYQAILGAAEGYLERVFGVRPQSVFAFDSYQYRDYSQYRADYWDETRKAEHRRVQFPLDCQSAREAGRVMALKVRAEG